MNFPVDKVKVTHQFDVGRLTAQFSIHVEALRPYPANLGEWYLVPRYLVSTRPFKTKTQYFDQIYTVTCIETTSGLDKPLSLVEFSAKDFADQKNSVVFKAVPTRLNLKTELLYFELRCVDGTPLELDKGGEFQFGISLHQVVPE